MRSATASPWMPPGTPTSWARRSRPTSRPRPAPSRELARPAISPMYSLPSLTPPERRWCTPPSSAAATSIGGAPSPLMPPATPTSPARPSPPISPPRTAHSTEPSVSPATARAARWTIMTPSLPSSMRPVPRWYTPPTWEGATDIDDALGIAVDSAGSAYVTGETGSADFPTTPGAFRTTRNVAYDAYVTKLNPSGSALVYSTFIGGSQVDFGVRIAVDASHNAYVLGNTSSADFPTTPGAFNTSLQRRVRYLCPQAERCWIEPGLFHFPRRAGHGLGRWFGHRFRRQCLCVRRDCVRRIFRPRRARFRPFRPSAVVAGPS